MEWNPRPRTEVMEQPLFFRCADCKRVAQWDQNGDRPERCWTCSKKHNEKLKGGRDTAITPWDLSAVRKRGSLLGQLDKVLHWCPERRRYMYWTGLRWEWGSDLDAHRIVLAVLRHRRLAQPRNSTTSSGLAPKIQAALADFRALCEGRAS